MRQTALLEWVDAAPKVLLQLLDKELKCEKVRAVGVPELLTWGEICVELLVDFGGVDEGEGASGIDGLVDYFNTFHVIGWATDALADVRRVEWNRLRNRGNAASAKEFKRAAVYVATQLGAPVGASTRRDPGTGQREPAHVPGMAIERRTSRHLRDAAAARGASSPRRLDQIRDPVPTETVRETRPHDSPLPGLDRSDHRMATHKRIAESNNARIGRLRTAARGFQTAKAFITMIYLDRAGIKPTLPWATT